MTTTIRPGRPDDANVLGDICFRAFQAISEAHRFPWDLPSVEAATGLMRMCLNHPGVQSFVAEERERPVGSNFLWKGDVMGVGPITVNPEVQNAGIGRLLMVSPLNATANAPAVRLVQAGYHMRSLSLYAKLGFQVREPLVVFTGTPLNRSTPGLDVRSGRESDLARCHEICLQIHGHTRKEEVADALSHGSLKVVEFAGEIAGYSTGIGYFGHSVARSNAALKALFAAADAFIGPGAIVPMRNSELFNWCLEQGLRAALPLNLMSKGLYNQPAGPFLPSILY